MFGYIRLSRRVMFGLMGLSVAISTIVFTFAQAEGNVKKDEDYGIDYYLYTGEEPVYSIGSDMEQSIDTAVTDEGIVADPNLAQTSEEEQKVKKEQQKLWAERQKIFDEYFEMHSKLGMVDDKLERAEEKLKKEAERTKSIEEKLASLDKNIRQKARKVERLEKTTNDKSHEIARMSKQIQIKNQELESLEGALGSLIRNIYVESNNGTLELLLTSDTFAEAVERVDSLEVMEGEGERIYERVRKVRNYLNNRKQIYREQKEQLLSLNKELSREKSKLEELETAQVLLLEKAVRKEEVYSDLVEAIKAEHEDMQREIESIEEQAGEFNLATKLKALQAQFGDKYQILNGDYAWPVDPVRGITAYFKDPGYRATFGFVHLGIDIRANQNTPFRAAADGYVLKAESPADASYNTVIIYHGTDGDGAEVITIYGHVSEVLVREGEYIKKGQEIGLTGGMPGSLGAGKVTTGPHLHFEMHVGGEAVNPIDYLP